MQNKNILLNKLTLQWYENTVNHHAQSIKVFFKKANIFNMNNMHRSKHLFIRSLIGISFDKCKKSI